MFAPDELAAIGLIVLGLLVVAPWVFGYLMIRAAVREGVRQALRSELLREPLHPPVSSASPGVVRLPGRSPGQR